MPPRPECILRPRSDTNMSPHPSSPMRHRLHTRRPDRGAGLSGIGAACHLQTEAPGTCYAILEARERTAGPGTCSGFRAFAPTRTCSRSATRSGRGTGPRRSPTAPRSCATCGTPRAIRRRRRSATATGGRGADWSRATRRAGPCRREQPRPASGPSDLRLPVRLLRLLPLRPRATRRTGRAGQLRRPLVHPQDWPADLDLTGQRVVRHRQRRDRGHPRARHGRHRGQVTMLQRSPSYVMSHAAAGPYRWSAAPGAARRAAYPASAGRTPAWPRRSTSCASASGPEPSAASKGATSSCRRASMSDTHFAPGLRPLGPAACAWCRTATSSRRSNRPGRRGDRPHRGVHRRPASGCARRGQLDADVVVTATGLNLLPLGGIELTVDGEPVTCRGRWPTRA